MAGYYVKGSGNDSHPGTQGQPFKTWQKAADVANPGDTVVADPDVKFAGFNLNRKGTQTSPPITFMGDPAKPRAVINAGKINLKETWGVIIRHIRCEGLSSGIWCEGPTGGRVLIDDCNVEGSSSSGIRIQKIPYARPTTNLPPASTPFQDFKIHSSVVERCCASGGSGLNEQITCMNEGKNLEIWKTKVGHYISSQDGGELIDIKCGWENVWIHECDVYSWARIALYIDGGAEGKVYPRSTLIKNVLIEKNRFYNGGGSAAIQLSTEATGSIENFQVAENTIQSNGLGVLIYIHPSSPTWAAPRQPGLVHKGAIWKNTGSQGRIDSPTCRDIDVWDNMSFSRTGPNVNKRTDTSYPAKLFTRPMWEFSGVVTPPVEPPPPPPPPTTTPGKAQALAALQTVKTFIEGLP